MSARPAFICMNNFASLSSNKFVGGHTGPLYPSTLGSGS